MSVGHSTRKGPKPKSTEHFSDIAYPRYLVGHRVGQLIITGPPICRRMHKAQHRCVLYPVRCDCGIEKLVIAKCLGNGEAKSCGCARVPRIARLRFKHGESESRLFNIWSSMLRRCRSPKDTGYKNYGARGISVCDAWTPEFIPFRDWALANGYRDDLTIERKDVNGNYEPENCCWIPIGEQPKNTRRVRCHTAFGKTLTIADWARESGIKYITLVARLNKNGGDIVAALTAKSRYSDRPTPRYSPE